MIKIYSCEEVEQGTETWLQLRSQYITGTDAYSILKGKTIEEILDKKQNQKAWSGNYYTKRGHILEDEAKEIYTELYQKVDNAGFITNDDYPFAGYSPDGLVGEDGLVECKAFQEERHLKVYENLDPHILAQIQFGFFVSGRTWCDLILYNPDMEDLSKAFLTRRVEPIPEIQDKLKLIFKKG